MKNFVSFTLIILFATMLVACGGGGDAAQSTQGTVKTVIKASALSANLEIGGVQMTIALPAGVKPATNSDGTVNEAAALEFISSAEASFQVKKITYNSVNSQLEFSVVNLAGFSADELIVLHLLVSPGATPVASDFSIVSSDFFDKTTGAAITGINPTLTATIH